MRIRRAHLLLAGALAFMTSGVDVALPALLHPAQAPSCPHCSMRGCRCGAGCGNAQRCRRPDGMNPAADHGPVSRHGGRVPTSTGASGEAETSVAARRETTSSGETGAGSPAERAAAISPRCSSADRHALPPAADGRPALIARSAPLATPGAGGDRVEPAEVRPTAVMHEPPTPPPRPRV